MRPLIPLLLLAALGLAFWALGGMAALERAVLLGQRDYQAVLAGTIRALKAGGDGAALALVGLGFGYGVLHAAGPGHGKLVLGAWALTAKAARARVAVITLIASLAQASTAVALVLGGVWALGLGRKELQGLAEGPVERASNLLLLGLGLWLLWRGARGFWRGARGFWRLRQAPQSPDHHHDHHAHGHHADGHHAHGHHADGHHAHGHHADGHHDHMHEHHDSCGCGHAHAPDPNQAARASLPEALTLIGAVALRPCTGAIFLLLLTLKIDQLAIGILATYAMGLGTALVTLAVALGATHLRDQSFSAATPLLRQIGHGLELALGALIVALLL